MFFPSCCFCKQYSVFSKYCQGLQVTRKVVRHFLKKKENAGLLQQRLLCTVFLIEAGRTTFLSLHIVPEITLQ